MFDIYKLNSEYGKFRVQGFDKKWLSYFDLQEYFKRNNFPKEEIGKSFLGNSIYKLSFGTGAKRILIWSQMHGNESTGTRAMFDVLEFLHQNSDLANYILKNLQIDFIPMLNPDGSNVYSRRNAAGIDINRDLIAQSSPEIHVLLNQITKAQYDVLFNLHDQRTIFNVGNTAEPATLSFLAASGDFERTITPTREKAMEIICSMHTDLKGVLPGKIGRYTDEYYPTATGDNFIKMGFPTILIEAGHYPEDYERNEVRKYNALSILSASYSITNDKENSSQEYNNIPENGNKFLDVLIRNVLIKSKVSESKVDLGIYFEDFLDEKEQILRRKAKLVEIGDLNNKIGHFEWNAEGRAFSSEERKMPKLNQTANFFLGEIKVENGEIIF